MLSRAAQRCGGAAARWLRQQQAEAACSSGFGPSTSYASSSSGDSSAAADGDVARKGMVNKLLYRSKQRGFLELDLLVGLWAEREIPKMSSPMLADMSTLLDEENPDLFKWLTGQLPAPERLLQNPAFMALHEHVSQQVQESSPQATRAKAGANWVRGWDDNWRSPKQEQAAGTGAAPPSAAAATATTPAGAAPA